MINDETNTICQPPTINALYECTKAQQEYINKYRSSLIKDGYTPKFAEQTCVFIIALYQEGIEKELEEKFPKDIDAATTWKDGSTNITGRKEITTWLKTIMEKYGGDYNTVANWLTNHQSNSWSNAAKAMKYFLISNLKEDVSVDDRFYLGTYTKYDLEAAYNSAVPTQKEKKCYETSMLMYKAFTAIVLSTVKIQFIDQSTQMVTVKRGDKKESMQLAYQKFDLSACLRDKELPIVRGGIADSTSLGVANSKFSGEGYLVRTFGMPFSRIHAVYFISQEICCDSSSKLKTTYAAEREIICDMSNLQSKISGLLDGDKTTKSKEKKI